MLTKNTSPVDATDLPEPRNLRTASATTKSGARAETMQFMSSVDAPSPKTLQPRSSVEAIRAEISAGARNFSSQIFERDEHEWFAKAPIETPVVKKTSFFGRMASMASTALSKGAEVARNFLDAPVPSRSVLAATVGFATIAVNCSNFSKMATAEAAQSSVQATTLKVEAPAAQAAPAKPAPETKQEAQKAPAKTLAETQPDAKSLNKLLVEKNAQIVEAAGGTNANYLYSSADYGQLRKMLAAVTGFEDVLNHPEVKKAENTAQFVNLVDQYFGGKKADYAEVIASNAAARHLTASQIAALR